MMSNSRNVHSALSSTASSAGRLMPGQVTWRSCCQAVAPSTRAASYSDRGNRLQRGEQRDREKREALPHRRHDHRGHRRVARRRTTRCRCAIKPRSRRIALTTPNDASSIHRNAMLTITPGTAHGSSSRLRSQRRAGKRAMEQQREQQPGEERGRERPDRVDRRVTERVPQRLLVQDAVVVRKTRAAATSARRARAPCRDAGSSARRRRSARRSAPRRR